jgi:rod shape-determining protein MreD
MRWLPFFILAYITLGLEAGLSRAIEWKSAAPDLVLLAVVFLALSAPRDTALLACFILGLLHDFTSHGTLGLFAFSYGLSAVFIVALQQAVNRRHALTHFALAGFVGLTVAIILSLHGWLRPPLSMLNPPGPVVHPPAAPLFLSAIYSAILAPFILAGLQKISGVFHFQTGRGRM